MSTLFSTNDVGKIYEARIPEFRSEGLNAGLSSSSRDAKRIMLLIVDMQVDFVYPEGSLSVPGATDDAIRLIKWIYKNADKIIVLDEGKIIDEGTHEKLVGKKGLYAEMFMKQAVGYQ